MKTHSLPQGSEQALSIARKIRLNIAMNWRKPCFHAIACRLWDEATRAGIPPHRVHGFLAVLG